MLIASYAKINLFLEVLGKLPDNYHQINTVFCSIDLHDTIRFALTKKPHVKLLSNVSELVSKENLIYKIGTFLLDNYNPNKGIEIYLDKQIPLAAGLGGGSSNAAITLMALNKLWSLNLSIEELESIAAQFGSDIVFFLHGGTSMGSNRGEVIFPLDDMIYENILLVNPNIRITSREAYQLTELHKEVYQRLNTDGSFKLFNRLELAIREKYHAVDRIINGLYDHGAETAMMSGSGSTCFGIFSDPESLDISKNNFQKQGFWTRKTRTISKKEYKECFQS